MKIKMKIEEKDEEEDQDYEKHVNRLKNTTHFFLQNFCHSSLIYIISMSCPLKSWNPSVSVTYCVEHTYLLFISEKLETKTGGKTDEKGGGKSGKTGEKMPRSLALPMSTISRRG